MGHLTFITGPTRSGKSRRAITRAADWGQHVVFAATYRQDETDAEMTQRVLRHRVERPAWRTLEAADDIAAELHSLRPPPGGLIVDCLTLWIGARFECSDAVLESAWDAQLASFRAAPWPTIVVSNEVGWSLVPPDAAARRFRDLAGTLAQRTAAAADEAWLMVAGCALRLK
jgi:adenosylcobinamide kinase/adenosylcobinamide-phosphate guanylyltransferase